MIFIILFLISIANAGETPEGNYYVSPTYGVSDAEDKRLGFINPKTKEVSTLPPIEDRDALFQAIDLETDIKAWRHMERDLLYLRAKGTPLSELRILYPNLPPAKLAKLVKQLQDRR